MLGAYRGPLGVLQLGQIFGSLVPPEPSEPDVLELVASFSGPLQLAGSASGALTLDAAFSAGIDLVGTVES